MKKLILIMMFSILSVVNAEWKPAQVEIAPIDTIYKDNRNMYFIGLDCADSMNCVAIANDSYFFRVVYHSNDAGKNWKIIYKPDYGIYKNKPLFKSISYPSKNKCLIGADSGYIYLTNDLGLNWVKVNTPISEQPIKYPGYITIKSIQMYDSTFGIANSDFFVIYTKDGGSTWNMIAKQDSLCGIVDAVLTSPTTILFYAKCEVSKNCPYTETIFISRDTGLTWSSYDYSYIDSCKTNYNGSKGTLKLYFVDSLNGWAVGGDPILNQEVHTVKISATTDGGKTWRIQFNEVVFPNTELWDVSFYDKVNGIAVSKAGGIIRTSNGGLTWRRDSVDFIQSKQPPLMYVCYKNIKNPVIADYVGRIFYEDGITSVNDIGEFKDFNIYPNPVTDYLTINTNQEIGKIEIFSALGLKVLETEWKEKIDVRNLPEGIYFLIIKSGNYTETKKFIIMR